MTSWVPTLTNRYVEEKDEVGLTTELQKPNLYKTGLESKQVSK